MNRKALCALGVLMLSFSAIGCGSSGSSGGTGGAGGGAATGSGGAKGSGGATGSGGASVPTVASACASYCTKFPDSCPTCASLSPVLTACTKFCIAERDCDPGGSVEDSMNYRCIEAVNLGQMSLDTLAANCKTATTAWFNCLATQPMVCLNGMANQPGACTSEATALSMACNPP